MTTQPSLSIEMAEWLETERKIPSEVAERCGVVTLNGRLAFEYRTESGLLYRKMRIVDENGEKSFQRDRKNATTCLFLEHQIQDDPDLSSPLVICEGECFPGETEVLTPSGWIALQSYRGGLVAQAHTDGTLSWSVPIAKVEKDYDGPLVRFENKFLSVTTTPGHNVVAIRKGRWIKQRADEVYGHGILPRSGLMSDGAGIALSNDEIAFCLAVAADATIDVRKQSYAGGRPAAEARYGRLSFSKHRKIDRLRDILSRIGLDAYEGPTTLSGKTGSFFGVPLPDWVPGRHLPWSWLVDATAAQREFIISELTLWDGNTVPDRDQTEFSTKHADQATWVQALCHLSGRCSTIKHRSNDFGEWFCVSLLHSKPHSDWQVAKKGRHTIPYNGRVHCLQMPSGMLLVRQEGAVHISGNCDALSLVSAGVSNVVSVPDGAQLGELGKGQIVPAEDTAFGWLWEGDKLKPHLARFERIILATDNDKKGQILREELAVRFERWRCDYVTFPAGCKDANDVLVKHGPAKLLECVELAKPMVPNRLCAFGDIPETGTGEIYGSGFKGLDDQLGFGMVIPEFVVITGQPGSGKSEFSAVLGANLANYHQLPGAILQFEDRSIRVRETLIRYAQTAVAETKGYRQGAREWVDKWFRTIEPDQNLDLETDYTLAWLMETIKEARVRHGCRWVIIDPWNEIEHLWDRSQNEAAYTNDALRKLKRIARAHQIILMIVAHPSMTGGRQQEIQDMNGYMISGSAAWANKADHLFIIHRPDQAKEDVYVKVAKSKDHTTMGRPGIVRMKYLIASAQYKYVGMGV